MDRRLLIPGAIVAAGLVIGAGLAFGLRPAGQPPDNPAPAATPSLRAVNITAQDAGRRFGALAARRGVGAPFNVSSAYCAPETGVEPGTFRCLLQLGKPSLRSGSDVGRPSPATPRAQLYRVSYSSDKDREPQFSALGTPSPEESRAIYDIQQQTESSPPPRTPNESASDYSCPPGERGEVRVEKASSALGCDVVLELAAQTVTNGGFLQTEQFFCRWAGGAAPAESIDGEQFSPGFCTRTSDEVEAGFYARPIE